MRRLIWDYIWDGQETGGHYEGMRAMSVVPGMGMLVNGEAKRHNIIPHFPSVDDGGLKRGISPGAGAVTHHHNFTWLVGHDLVAGDELFLDYGPGWFRERGFVDTAPPKKWEVSHLRQTGYCLDNIAPGPSLVKGAARGGFATRDLEKGSIIAPVPVIALSSASLEMIKERTDGSTVTSTQLLKNYCFGHPDSKLLLYPYSHGINLVNHHSSIPNAKLQWWAGSILYFNKTLLELQQSSQLMLELVATRPIKNGEEIYLDYGNEWAKAWKDHVDSWQAEPDNRHISAESMNNRKEEYFILRTEKEQQSHPYPADVFTSCYYSYSDYSSKNHHPLSTTNSAPTRSITEWKPTSRVISLRNLRPCLVIRRDIARTNVNNNGDSSSQIYTVRVMNRVGLAESERIPKGHAHLVTHVPRHAIVFSDKIYTSDQHLLNSFRKEIGLGDLFPSQWKDFQND